MDSKTIEGEGPINTYRSELLYPCCFRKSG